MILKATSSDYSIFIEKRVAGSFTVLLPWTTVSNAEGTFRIKFEETKSGHGHTHIYYHDGTGSVDESQDEVAGSPFDLDLAISSGYCYYYMGITEATNRTVSSDFVRVTYPNFSVKYDLDDADVNKGDVKVWDTMGETDESLWQRVLSEDHKFEGDCVIENGLIRLWIDEGTHQGLKFYYWNGNSWTLQISDFGIWRAVDCDYPFLKSIDSLTIEKAVVNVRLEDTSTEDGDNFVDVKVTLKRGSYIFEIDPQDAYPSGSIELDMRGFGGGFVYVQDDLIGGGKVGLTANNTTMTDNHIIAFNDAGNAVLIVVALNQKPAAGNKRFRSWMGDTIEVEQIADADIQATTMYIGLIPFSKIANLFKEAEDAVQSTGVTVDTTQTDDSGDSVVLDAQSEFVEYQITGITDLPKGRYIMFVRAKDSAQVADDLHLVVFKENGGVTYLNEENADTFHTLTSSFAYYGIVFDITENEDGDLIHLRARKDTATTNTIWIDYFLIFPISNGKSWPQDIAHNALRTFTKKYKVFRR